jgi:hypothetical protein
MPWQGSIVVSQNAVTSWERYGHTFTRSAMEGLPGHRKVDAEEGAEGGWGTAHFTIYGDVSFLADFFERGLSRHVEFYDEEATQVYEGMLYAMTLFIENEGAKISLDDVWNRGWMRFRVRGSGTTGRSTVTDMLDSQGRFGIKEKVLQGAELESIAVADQAVASYLRLHKWPRATPENMKTGLEAAVFEPPQIQCACEGYWKTLEWQVYNQTASHGAQGADVEINDIVTAKAQFVAVKDIRSDPTPVSKEYDVDRTPADLLSGICRLGLSDYTRVIPRMTNGGTLYVGDAAPPVLPPV